MGSWRMLCFYFAAGISANIFAAAIDDEFACGAEPAMFALLAGLIGMYVYYWDRMGNDWCRKLCGLFMCIFLLVIGIFFLTSVAQPYKDWTDKYHIRYPDSMGFFGGALFGMPMSWIFLAPTSGTLKNSSRREKGLFIGGLVWSVLILVIVVLVFSFENEPEAYSKWDLE